MRTFLDYNVGGAYGGYEVLGHRYFAQPYQGDVEFQGLPECSMYLMDIYLIVHSSGLAYGPALRFNGDSGNNYQLTKASLTNTPRYYKSPMQSFIEIGSLMGTPEAAFMRAVFPGKANISLAKQLVGTWSYTNGSGAGDIHYHAGYWNNGDKINRISIVPYGIFNGTIGVGTYMTLYGMR